MKLNLEFRASSVGPFMSHCFTRANQSKTFIFALLSSFEMNIFLLIILLIESVMVSGRSCVLIKSKYVRLQPKYNTCNNGLSV